MRPDPSNMSSCHLLDEYSVVHRDNGRRRAEIRAQLENRLEGQPEIAKMRAQLQADDQRAWEALGRPGGTHDTTNVQRLCAEVERLRLQLEHVHSTSIGRPSQELYDATVAELQKYIENREAEVKQLRAELRRMSEWHDEIADTLRAEVDRLRAEVERLRNMLALLCAAVEHSAPGYGVYEDWCDISDYDILALRERMIEAKALLAKHKGTQ